MKAQEYRSPQKQMSYLTEFTRRLSQKQGNVLQGLRRVRCRMRVRGVTLLSSLVASHPRARDGDIAYGTFLASVILAGSFVLAWSVMDLSVNPIAPQWVMLVALTGVSGWATLRLRAIPASFSISDTFTIAAALLFGPAAGAVTVAVDALVMSLRLATGGRQPAPVRVLFNVTVPALTMWIAAQLFFTSAGVGPLAHAPGTIRGVLAPLGLFALLYFVLNTGLVATAVALERRANVVAIWRDHFAPLWLTYFGGASLAGVFVLMAVAQVIDLSALMLVLPLVVVLHLAYRAALDRANERLEHLARIASYATALRATADGVLIIDRDRRTTFMNAAGERLTGWTERHAIGRHVAEVLQPADAASGGGRDPLTTDEGSLHDYLLLDRAGRQRPIEVMHASIRNEAGEISGAIVTFRDVSERLAADAERDALLQREQRARLAADAASRLKDEFLTTLSHELRTPATSILGWARVLRTGRMGSANADHALDALERSAKAQAALIEDLLDVSRIVSGAMRLAFQTASVSGSASPRRLRSCARAQMPRASAWSCTWRTASRRFRPIRLDYSKCSGTCCRTRSSSPTAAGPLTRESGPTPRRSSSRFEIRAAG